MANLTLNQALSNNRLDAFIARGEAEGVGPADRAQLDK